MALCNWTQHECGVVCTTCETVRDRPRMRVCRADSSPRSKPPQPPSEPDCPHLLGPVSTDTGELLYAKTPKRPGCGSCGNTFVSECELYGLISELRTDATLDGERLPSCVGCEERPG